MTSPRRKPSVWFAAALVWLASAAHAQAQPEQIDTIKDVYAKLYSCWRPPPASRANPIDITVIVSFNREGAILGQPRITYESANAGDERPDRVPNCRNGNIATLYAVAIYRGTGRCGRRPAFRGHFQNPQTSTQT